jgi:hypothetical protein
MGLKRDAGRGSFIQSVIDTTKSFYGDVLQHLTAWKPRPAKLASQPSEEETLVEAVSEEHPPLAEPIEEAQAERTNDLDIRDS